MKQHMISLRLRHILNEVSERRSKTTPAWLLEIINSPMEFHYSLLNYSHNMEALNYDI